jgi:dihydrofolate synthase/folylpolyglutamate synthase
VNLHALKAGEPPALPGSVQTACANSVQPNGSAIILDGAHNQDSARALAETIMSVFLDRKCIFILGVNQDKDIESIWQELKKASKYLIATTSDNPRAMLSSEIILRISKTDPNVQATSCNNIDDALRTALSLATPSDLICVTGSLYLVAETREQIMEHTVS